MAHNRCVTVAVIFGAGFSWQTLAHERSCLADPLAPGFELHDASSAVQTHHPHLARASFTPSKRAVRAITPAPTWVTPAPTWVTPAPTWVRPAQPTPEPTPSELIERILTTQPVPGVCDPIGGGEIGCSNPDGTSGNPNDIVNCFLNDVTAVPFNVISMQFWLNGNLPLPDGDMLVRVWSGSPLGGPTSLLHEEALPSVVAGSNNVVLSTPFTVSDTEFCVGVFGGNVSDGFRIDTHTGDGTVSHILAPECGATSFVSLASIGFPDRDYCIEATISGQPL